MTSIPFKLTTPKSMAHRRLQLRRQLWPDVANEMVWDRKKAKGFTSVPRTLPIFQAMMDRASISKPVSSTYLDLWCRANDEGFLECRRVQEMAFSSGFTTSRGIHIWAERITILEKQGFIKVAAGANGPRSFILILNPYHVVSNLRTEGQIEDQLWNALLSQMSQIGASDLETPQTSSS